MSRPLRPLVFAVTIALAANTGRMGAQQGPGPEFTPPIGTPAYASGTGPRVAIDGGHNNLHTVDGGYRPFAELLRRDGYRVAGITAPFSDESLRDVDVLVIVNASAPRGTTGAAAADPSVFSDAEVEAVDRHVTAGGALLLVADHEPWPAVASKIAARLRVEFKNAYAYDGSASGNLVSYRKADGALAAHAVTEGVSTVVTFLGSAFRVNAPHVPLLRFGPAAVARPTLGNAPHPDEVSIAGWLQGALVEHGKGRAAVFGEAAMFSAQVRGGRAMGMNAPGAEDNVRFTRNVMRWLAAK
jgi:hypothetical protein